MEFKLVATNKKAFRDFALEDKWECGIALKGAEVKSLRAGGANFTDSFASIDKGEIYLYNLHIPPYAQGNEEIVPDRKRKLLMHKNEIITLKSKLTSSASTLIPLECYISKGFFKLKIALAKGKKEYQKREKIRRRDIDRDTQREIRDKK